VGERERGPRSELVETLLKNFCKIFSAGGNSEFTVRNLVLTCWIYRKINNRKKNRIKKNYYNNYDVL